MAPFLSFTGRVVPLDRNDVDTDQIIPKQYLKSVVRTGLGRGLFHDWRFLANGEPDPAFVLNQPRYAGATILLGGVNFGCGSSREHAPWALRDGGFACVIAVSFADIFFNNSCKNGLLPVALPAAEIRRLMDRAAAGDLSLSVSLENRTVEDGLGWRHGFALDEHRHRGLLLGLDEIAMTLSHESAIAGFEAARVG